MASVVLILRSLAEPGSAGQSDLLDQVSLRSMAYEGTGYHALAPNFLQ